MCVISDFKNYIHLNNIQYKELIYIKISDSQHIKNFINILVMFFIMYQIKNSI